MTILTGGFSAYIQLEEDVLSVCVCGFVFLCAYVRMRVCMYSLLLLR